MLCSWCPIFYQQAEKQGEIDRNKVQTEEICVVSYKSSLNRKRWNQKTAWLLAAPGLVMTGYEGGGSLGCCSSEVPWERVYADELGSCVNPLLPVLG